MYNFVSYDYLARLFEAFDVELTSDQYQQFYKYAEVLTAWNQRVNLTRITEPEEIAEKHFLDSVAPLLFVESLASKDVCGKVIDVGSGAGFPGIPLLIMRSNIQLTLLDSLKKRLTFLEEVLKLLGLKANLAHARAEDGGRNTELRQKFDFATARAVAQLNVLAEYCIPYLKENGRFIALKGPGEELSSASNAISVLGGEFEDIKEYSLPSGDKRVIVIVRKVKATPLQYPRSAAQIGKNPL